MKQTITELGIGGEGWIIYDDFILPKRIAHITVVNKWTDNEFLLREDLESDAIKTTRDLIVPDDQIVYNTWGEAEKVRSEEISNTITSIVQKSVDWKKLADELGSIQKQFNEVAEDQKKDLCAFIKEIKNISNPQPYNTDWNQVRINAAIGALNALLESRHHNYSVLGKFAIKDTFIESAVEYADNLVYELKRGEAYFEEKLKNS
jgi:hypothetical protein